MDQWCDDFDIKVGDSIPSPNSNTLICGCPPCAGVYNPDVCYSRTMDGDPDPPAGWAPEIPEILQMPLPPPPVPPRVCSHESDSPAPSQPRLDTSWNIPNSSNTTDSWRYGSSSLAPLTDVWLMDPKIRFGPIVNDTYPQPSDDTGDALEYNDDILSDTEDTLEYNDDIPSDTKFVHSNTNMVMFSDSLMYSSGYLNKPGGHIVKYIDVLDVFRHVTLGGHLSDEHIDSFCKYVYNSHPDFKNCKTVKRTFINVDGRKFDRVMVMYTCADYLKMVPACVEWARCNPEKVVIV